MSKRWSDLHPQTREAMQSWMFADQLGIVDNDTMTYSQAFFAILELMLPTLDSKLPARERYEIVIMEYLKLSGRSVPNTESIKALSLAAGIANQTINEKLEQGMTFDEIIGRQPMIDDDDGINE